VLIKEPEGEEPTCAMLPGEAADLGHRRRGVEPLRVVIMPQQQQHGVVAAPMPLARSGS